MEDSHKQLFARLKEHEPSPVLFNSIRARISAAERSLARRRFFLTACGAFISGVLMVPALQHLSAEFATSGFYQYMSLLFSDSAILMSNWKTFTWSIAESLPALGLSLVLASAAAFFWSLGGMAKNAKRAFVRAQYSI